LIFSRFLAELKGGAESGEYFCFCFSDFEPCLQQAGTKAQRRQRTFGIAFFEPCLQQAGTKAQRRQSSFIGSGFCRVKGKGREQGGDFIKEKNIFL
jgi:hypothetical protein